jgi:hypothetical protein
MLLNSDCRWVLAATSLAVAWLAAGPAQARCFDFTTKVVSPLRPPPAAPVKGEVVEAGERASDIIWTKVRGPIAKAPPRVLALLLNHETMRDPEVDEMKVKKLASPLYLARHSVSYEVRPLPLVKVRWTEEWGYAVAEGPDDAPTAWVISYEKTEGTSHIEHFCGSIVLRRLPDGNTDMYQYEESKISRRDEKDQTSALRGLLTKLRVAP